MRHPRPLRRSTREVVDPAEIDAILSEATLLFLALADQPAPYVLPVCFGCADDILYVHSAKEGTKIDLLRGNPSVGFSAATGMDVVAGSAACDFSCTGRSVVGTGTARIVEDDEERRRGLDAIMRHYAAASGKPSYEKGSFSRTSVIAIHIETLCGKRVG